jgi:hypothetical protein
MTARAAGTDAGRSRPPAESSAETRIVAALDAGSTIGVRGSGQVRCAWNGTSYPQSGGPADLFNPGAKLAVGDEATAEGVWLHLETLRTSG